MSVEPQWFYWVITIPFVIVWLFLFCAAGSWRRAQLRVSAAFALVGIFIENFFYFKDYWHPPASVSVVIGPITIYPEFLFFGAAFAGIALVIYPISFALTVEKMGQDNAFSRLVLGASIFLTISTFFWYLGLNSIYATAGGALILALFVSWHRPDLLSPSLISGASVTGIMFVLYSLVVAITPNLEEIFTSIWYLHNTSLDIRFFSVPVTELIWGFCVGSSVAVFYMYVEGIRYRRIERHSLRSRPDGHV